MDALNRLIQIRRTAAIPGWSGDDFLRAASKGKRRWREVEEMFGIQYSIFDDALREIAPSFELSPEEDAAARSANIPAMRNVTSRIAVSFLKWERCPATQGLPNPYEPWIEIWEHGGAFGVEHGLLVDVYDEESMPVGAIVLGRG